jgi:DNA-binding PadR family transcriptional regulator
VYELIILSLLMRGATHGYVIAGVVNDVIGPFARASNGRLYPLLAKLEEDGLIAVHEEATSAGGRVSRSFSITDAGRVRFRRLMLDTSAAPREYRDLFAFKVTAFAEISGADRVAILQHYIEFAQAHVRHLQAQAQDLAQAISYGHTAQQRGRFGSVFSHLVAVWQHEAAWATVLLAAERPPPARAGRPKKISGSARR